MKRSGIVLLCSLVLLIGQMACKNRSKKPIDSLQADTIVDTSNELLEATRAIVDEKSLFASLVDKIPITPLPFGNDGLDTMHYYYLPPVFETYDGLWRDSLNIYGLNRFFQENEQIAVEYISDQEGFPFPLNDILPISASSDNFYFSKRFPPRNGNEYLLFNEARIYETRFAVIDSWWLVICNENGTIVERSKSIGSASNRSTTLFYIDKNHNVKTRTFGLPRQPTMSTGHSGYTIYEKDQIDTMGCSILWHDNMNDYVWAFNKPRRVVEDEDGGLRWAPESGLTNEDILMLINGK